MLEKLKAQIGILERAAKDEGVEIRLDEVKTVLFDSMQRIESLEKDLAERTAKVSELQPVADLGNRKIAETKAETLRLMTVVAEASPSKDMSRVERMKQRFESENLDIAAIERYFEDARTEFDAAFPVEGKAVPAKKEEEGRSTVDVSTYKIK